MPIDKDKRMAAIARSISKTYYPKISVQIRRDNPAVYEGLQKAAEDNQVTTAKYLVISLEEKLKRDGYI